MALINGNIVDESMCQMFRAETHDQLERMIAVLLQLEQNPGEESAVIQELFRIAHNIKGSSGMMGLESLKELMHAIENMFDAVRNGSKRLDEKTVDFLLNYSRQIMSYIEAGDWEDQSPISDWKEVFSDALGGASNSGASAEVALTLSIEETQEGMAWQREGKEIYSVEAEIAPDSMMPGASAILFLRFLETYGIIWKTSPDQETMRTQPFSLLKVVLKTENTIGESQEQEIVAYTGHGDVTVNLRKWVPRPEQRPSKAKTGAKDHAPIDTTLRVNSEKIDGLMNQIQELIILNASLKRVVENRFQGQTSWKNLEGISQHLEILVESIQTEIMSLRMVPVKQLFQRFPMVVREVARKRQKDAELVCLGEETEVDKFLAEHLANPLTHLVRNAVDHGLEDEEQRIHLGKPPVGRVTLEAKEEGEFVVIRISDDGQGLNLEKIRQKAVKNGLISNEETLTQEKILKLIFEPGFSTAEQVSDISGRGVGLDVVQDAIHALKGTIDVETVPGKGTTFRLKVPLTLAAIPMLLVDVVGTTYGIPLDGVVGGMLVNQKDLQESAGRKSYLLSEQEIPVLPLGEMLGIGSYTGSVKKPLLILTDSRRTVGIIVDEIVGQEKAVLKQINNAFGTDPMVMGAAFLGGGEMAVVLNPQQVIGRVATN